MDKFQKIPGWAKEARYNPIYVAEQFKVIYSDRKQSICWPQLGGITAKNHEKNFVMMNLFYILIVVVVTWVYAHLSAHYCYLTIVQ